jgi:pyruvate dehydrogenase E2 component (dihydrolipoamide acetyltransferase)
LNYWLKLAKALAIDTPIVLLESAKASMEVPSPIAGVVKEIAVSLGSKISEGVLLLQVETAVDTMPVVEAIQAAVINEPEKTASVKDVVNESNQPMSRLKRIRLLNQ